MLGGKPHDFGNQGNKQPAHADLIVQGTCLHFLQDHLDIICQRGVVGRGKNAAPAMQYLGQQAAVWQGCGVKEGAQQLLCIGKNIAPFAGTAGVGPGCMRNIPGNKGNIPGFERNNLPGKVHFPTVTFTNADFQAVVEMQYAGRYIGNAPFLTSNDPEREVGRKLITPVFNNGFAVAAHGGNLLAFVGFYAVSIVP